MAGVGVVPTEIPTSVLCEDQVNVSLHLSRNRSVVEIVEIKAHLQLLFYLKTVILLEIK